MSDPMAGSRGRQLCSDSWVMLATGFCIMVVALPGVAGAGRVAGFFYGLSHSYTFTAPENVLPPMGTLCSMPNRLFRAKHWP
jgi:hypothetical protein